MAAQQPADVDPAEREARQPMISGTRGGHSVSLHLLGNGGATLLGRLEGVEGRVLRIGDDLMTNVVHGDEGAKQLRAGLDTFIEKAGMDAPPAEVDPAERPFPNLATMAAIRALDLDETGIRSVIWATGFGGDFSYLDDALLDDRGLPRHDHGVGDDGLYCLGLMWQRRRISGLIAGIRDDAEHIVRHIENRGPD
jgi:putative flavoprotein involved in K+ transport